MTIKVGRVAMVPTANVIVDDRARKELGDLESMRDNMKENGLITPLAVLDMKDGNYRLLAGERRYTVLLSEGVPQIPARIYDEELDELDMAIIEDSENFFRKDMEWFERDALTRKIHNLQQERLGVKAPGPGGEGWGTRDTAEMIGAKSASEVSQAIKRANAMDAYPDLFSSCKSANDATKVLAKVSEAAIKQQIAQKVSTQSADVTLTKMDQSYILRDCFEGIKQIPDGIFHLVEIDPPYGIDLTKQKRKDGESQYMLDNYNEVDKSDYPAFLLNLFKECYRVMLPNSWLICWFGPEPWFEVIYRSLISAGFGTTRMCGIWTKSTPGQSMNPTIRLASSYEMFFYAWKGQPVLNKAGRSNDFRVSPVPPSQKTHPTERTIDLMKEVYDTFAFPGSRVLIPFLGSGNGIIAAASLGMSAVGFELSKGYKDSFLVKAHLLSQKGELN